MYKPIDKNGNVVIPKDLLDVLEFVAEDIHDKWSQARIEEGWTYGEIRDGESKLTPCLVPYSELPEEEKEYDRQTAITTIKSILKRGFVITKKIIE